MKDELFEAIVGTKVANILAEEANHRTNEESQTRSFIGIGGWRECYNRILLELKMDYLITHVVH